MAETKVVARLWLTTLLAGALGLGLVAWLSNGPLPG